MAATLLDTFLVELVFKGDRRELDKLERGIKNVNQRLNNLVRPLTIAGTAGAAALGLIGKAGLDTERALLRVRAELGLTEDQMRMLREEALKIGAQLPLNTADIVNAQRAYGKLGATFGEIIRDAPAIAGAAVATGLEPEQVARYARGVQNIFGGDVQENLDVMLRAANRSAGSFESFGESIQFAGQAAADAGLDFKAYVAILGGTSGAMRTVESVSQGMTAMWSKLAKSKEDIGEGGKIVQEAFEGVGISMADVDAAMDGTADGFIKLLALINNAGLSTTQLTALLSTLAGDTYSASISYAVQNPEVIRDLLAEVEQSAGDIVNQQQIIMSGASGGIMQMMAQIDTLLNRLAEFGTLTAIQNFTKAVSALIGWLTKTNEESELVNKGFLRLISAFVMALAAMLVVAAALKVTTFALSGFVLLVKAARGVVWLWRNALILTRVQMGLLSVQTWWANSALSRFAATIWTSSVGALKALATRLTMAGAAMLRFSGRAIAAGIAGVVAFAATIWTGAVPALAAFAAGVWATTIALLANPLTWIVLGIVALIAALVLAVKHWDKIKAVAVGAIDAVRGAVQWAWNWIKGNWPLLASILLGPFGIVGALIWKFRDQILGAFREVWDWLRESPIFGPVIDGIQAIIDFVRELPGRVVGILKDIPGMIADAIRDVPGLGAALEAFTGIAGKVGGFFGKVKESFAQGGIVPGPTGRPLLATVHGGEMILPPSARQVLLDMFEGFRLGPDALPQAPYHYGQMYRSSVTNRTVNINITEPIVIQTQATDAKGIAEELHEAIEDKIRNVAYDHDGPVER